MPDEAVLVADGGLATELEALARAARDQMAGDGRVRWVAASAGPYGAVLADGSEYRGGYGRSVRELAAGTGHGWRCWPGPALTCSRWRRCPISMTLRR